MAVTSNLSMSVKLSGDVVLDDVYSITANAVSPGQEQVIDLSSGFNSITIPTGGSSVPVGVLIRPPSSNTNTLVLKGVTGDTGVGLHATNPTFITLVSGAAFGITAGAAIAGVRFLFV